jgi:hypothetical protein
LKVAAPGADLIGSWFVAIGNQVRKQWVFINDW